MKRIFLTVLAFALMGAVQVTEAHDYEIFNHPHQSWNNHVSHHHAHYQAHYSGRYLCGHRSLGTYGFGHYRNVCTGRWEYGYYERFAGHELQDGPATQTFHQYLRQSPTSHHCETCRRSHSKSNLVAKRRTIGKTGKTLNELVQRARLRARIKYFLAKNDRALERRRLAKKRKKAQEQAAAKLAAEKKKNDVLVAEQVAETRKNDVPLTRRLASSIRMKRQVAPTVLVASRFK